MVSGRAGGGSPSLLCGHLAPYSQTFMPSGSMRSGRLFERPISVPAISATGSSSSPGLPTPRAWDWKTGGKDGLHETLRLFPTPRATDGTHGGPNQRGSKGDLALPAVAAGLLPTPRASDTGTPGRRSSEGFRPPLSQVVLPLLPTPRTSDSNGGGQHGSGGLDLRTAVAAVAVADADGEPRDQRRHPAPGETQGGGASAVGCGCDRAPWGRYASAVHRWEQVIGRAAPSPVDGRGRLSPAFVEFLMGLSEGHVTAVPGLSRNAQLKALGNGVVPAQAAAALRLLTARAAR